MATDIEFGACTLGDETAGSWLVQASLADQGTGGDAAQQRLNPPQKDKSVLEQFMQYLIPALGAWPT